MQSSTTNTADSNISTNQSESEAAEIGIQEVDVADRSVTLTLDRELLENEKATVSYTPNESPILSEHDGDAAGMIKSLPLRTPNDREALIIEMGHSTHQPFVRVINHSQDTSKFQISAYDEQGKLEGQAELNLNSHTAVNFNSNDLTHGNSSKGLDSALVTDEERTYRLELTGDEDVELLTYARVLDGYMTPMHHRVPPTLEGEHHVYFFNPGRNRNQKSTLRLINPNASRTQATIKGIDDEGTRTSNVEVSLSAYSIVDLSAADLEAGIGVTGALGKGVGKWRLTVSSSDNLSVQSLIESPDGFISNVSTSERLIDQESNSIAVPLFPAANDEHSREGLVRVVNHSDQSGVVYITARDESGTIYDRVSLELKANGAAQFNSNDLELGNSNIGLSGSTGSGQGAWYLTLTSELEFDVFSYIVSNGEYIVPVHEIAPEYKNIHKVALFSPSSDASENSLLRIINPSNNDVLVEISGTDDWGWATSSTHSVHLTVPAQNAVELTATELETGEAESIQSGALGYSQGLWRLTLSSDYPIKVFSFCENSDGVFSNVSKSSRTHVPKADD